MTLPKGATVEYGDVVMLIGKDRKTLIRTVRQGEKIQIHLGEIDFDKLVGVPYGGQFKTHQGRSLVVLAPSLDDFFTHIQRSTQIIYPKDLGYIALKLGLQQGARVIEAGSGSGVLTSMLALMVGDEGHVYSYERRAASLQQAKANVQRLGLEHRVTFFERDIYDGFEQTDVQALFLDVANPHDFLDIAWKALQGGGFFGAIVPTVNQLIDLLTALQNGPWFLLQADELIRRSWKTVPARVRPDENMYGHTGILVFARSVYRDVPVTPSEEYHVEPDES